MCYRCEVCDHPSQPGANMLRHVVQRKVPWQGSDGRGRMVTYYRTEIEREWAVCRRCDAELRAGIELGQLLKLHRPQPPASEPVEELIHEFQAPAVTPVRLG